ncbi:unnamed protein product [Lactuca saligna]|uniref:Helitron helicase-like domain-containing protein n=1 Tax=Lactuca saligna TaxID=75948 RepID=A0AA35YEC6_LACSI|nr:unnamed protein product [Lactuca saligna]
MPCHPLYTIFFFATSFSSLVYVKKSNWILLVFVGDLTRPLISYNDDATRFYKKEYRRRAILRSTGKRSRSMQQDVSMCGLCEVSSVRLIQLNNSTENHSSCLGETSKNIKGKHKCKNGRELLMVIPSVADRLPNVANCYYCVAGKFYSETNHFCCSDCSIVLSNNELPVVMRNLLCSASEEAKMFRTYVRSYNNLFSFTSFGVKVDKALAKRNKGIYTFRVQGQVYHFINEIMPQNNSSKSLQLYFHHTEHEIKNSPFHLSISLRDVPDLDNYKIILKTIADQDQRVYNKPEVSQVAAIWINGEDNGDYVTRCIEVKMHNNESKSVQYYFGYYDPLQYPLMFPFGELGWHQEDLLAMEESSKYWERTLITQIDNFVKLERQRLVFSKTKQHELQQEFLQGVVDVIASGETDALTIGKRVVLPADFIGGPRNMKRKYMDAMALVQKVEKPDIFLTTTCNPNWPEIKEHLMSHEETHIGWI